jgi:hypothetical protein
MITAGWRIVATMGCSMESPTPQVPKESNDDVNTILFKSYYIVGRPVNAVKISSKLSQNFSIREGDHEVLTESFTACNTFYRLRQSG